MKSIFTIPNILSTFRISLIPFIVWYYYDDFKYHMVVVAALVVVSGITDVVDGFIARRFNMVSDVGKYLTR